MQVQVCSSVSPLCDTAADPKPWSCLQSKFRGQKGPGSQSRGRDRLIRHAAKQGSRRLQHSNPGKNTYISAPEVRWLPCTYPILPASALQRAPGLLPFNQCTPNSFFRCDVYFSPMDPACARSTWLAREISSTYSIRKADLLQESDLQPEGSRSGRQDMLTEMRSVAQVFASHIFANCTMHADHVETGSAL